LATKDDDGEEYQHVDVLQPLGVATLDLMKGVQNDVELGEHAGDCRSPPKRKGDIRSSICARFFRDVWEKLISFITVNLLRCTF